MSFALQYCNCDNSEPRFGIGVWNGSPYNLSQSAPNAAYLGIDLGYSITMTSGARFNFQGANFGGVYAATETSTPGVFRGFRSGVQVYSLQMSVPDVGGGPPGRLPFIDFNWMDIDSLYIQGQQINSGYLAMDNFTYQEVPTPAGLSLLGSALGLLGLRQRKG